MQELVVERLVALHWRLRRLLGAERRLLQHTARHDPRQAPADLQAALICNGAEADRISAHANRLENSIHRCMRELRMLRKDADEHQPDEEVENATSQAGEDADVEPASPIEEMAPPTTPLRAATPPACSHENVRNEPTAGAGAFG